MTATLLVQLAPWAAALAAAWAVATLIVPGPSPRRFPEDDVAVAAEPRRGTSRTPPRRRLRRPARTRSTGRCAHDRDGPDRWPGERDPGERDPGERDPGVRDPDDLTDLATCCDLLAVAVASGSPVGQALASVGSVGDGPVARSLGRAAESIRRGSTVVEAIDRLGAELGPSGQALSSTLATSVSSGAAPAPSLRRLADAERRRARRRVEARVRRLPVLLLLPLVGLILPAFVLLTLVPVGLSVARSADGLAGAARPPGPIAPTAIAPPAFPPPAFPSTTSTSVDTGAPP